MLELHTCTKFAQQPIKFFMFHKSASVLLLMILIMQNITSIVLFIVINFLFKMMSDRGLPLAMVLRGIAVSLTGKVKPQFYPRKRRDHLFTN